MENLQIFKIHSISQNAYILSMRFHFSLSFKKLLDPWFRYGRAAYRSRVVTGCFAVEDLLLVAKILWENGVAMVCPYRPITQFSCSLAHCNDCPTNFFDVTGLLKMQSAGMLAYLFILQLPIARRLEILK